MTRILCGTIAAGDAGNAAALVNNSFFACISTQF